MDRAVVALPSVRAADNVAECNDSGQLLTNSSIARGAIELDRPTDRLTDQRVTHMEQRALVQQNRYVGRRSVQYNGSVPDSGRLSTASLFIYLSM
jgi:hypothetical protein